MPTGKLKHPWDCNFTTKDSLVFDDKFFKLMETSMFYTSCNGAESTVTFCNSEIENVIFNDPATIVFWDDGTKTVVKADDEPFDKEKGLAMAISKKFYGNKGKYFNEFKKWID